MSFLWITCYPVCLCRIIFGVKLFGWLVSSRSCGPSRSKTGKRPKLLQEERFVSSMRSLTVQSVVFKRHMLCKISPSLFLQNWKKFGNSERDAPGPNVATTTVSDDVFMTFISSKDVRVFLHWFFSYILQLERHFRTWNTMMVRLDWTKHDRTPSVKLAVLLIKGVKKKMGQ